MRGPVPDILYRDERIIVLDKPTGLLSVPGIGPEKADCLASRVAARHPGARIVHRLDRDTSGVIVMALDAEAHRALSVQFQDRLVRKTYVAIVAGVMRDERGVVDLPLRKDRENPPCHVVDRVHGRAAVTHWRVLEREGDRTRVELSPLTGRSHQLRIHLAELGHPILGDDLYAPPPALAAAERLLLHALELVVVHPGTAELLTFHAPCPF